MSDELHAPAALPPGKMPAVPIGGWVDPRAGLEDVEKGTFLNLYRHLNSDPSVVQPVASRYTDWAIPAPQGEETEQKGGGGGGGGGRWR
jgi:hypothetical protein